MIQPSRIQSTIVSVIRKRLIHGEPMTLDNIIVITLDNIIVICWYSIYFVVIIPGEKMKKNKIVHKIYMVLPPFQINFPLLER